MRTYSRVFIVAVLFFGLSVAAYPSIHSQSFLFKDSVLRIPQFKDSPFLFSQQVKDTSMDGKNESLKLKDPRMAVFYSFIPGIVFHGAGHIYAGKIGTGLLLFGSEIVGGGLLTIGAIGVAFSQDEYGESAWKPGYVLIATGTFLFLGSWFYDLIGSPLAVNKQNQILMQKKNTELKFQLKDKDLRLAIVWHF
jgi:hypothetical protein